jgi:hypothetical protein
MSKSKSQKIFYCYVLLDSSKPGIFKYGDYKFKHEPLYVGKGHNKRSEAHFKEAAALNADGSYKYTNHKVRRIRKILKAGYEVLIKHSRNLGTEDVAFEREVDMITTIGRRNKGEGPLTNGTDGGAGGVGRVESKALRQAKSKRMKEYIAVHGPRIVVHSEATKEKLRQMRLGTTQSAESNHKRSIAQKGIPKPWISMVSKGRVLPAEWRKAISEGQRGNKRSLQAWDCTVK